MVKRVVKKVVRVQFPGGQWGQSSYLAGVIKGKRGKAVDQMS